MHNKLTKTKSYPWHFFTWLIDEGSANHRIFHERTHFTPAPSKRIFIQPGLKFTSTTDTSLALDED